MYDWLDFGRMKHSMRRFNIKIQHGAVISGELMVPKTFRMSEVVLMMPINGENLLATIGHYRTDLLAYNFYFWKKQPVKLIKTGKLAIVDLSMKVLVTWDTTHTELFFGALIMVAVPLEDNAWSVIEWPAVCIVHCQTMNANKSIKPRPCRHLSESFDPKRIIKTPFYKYKWIVH